jgi:tetratricopeptide (TPR) repeat protein
MVATVAELRGTGTTDLEEAVARYRAALTVWTRDRAAYNWATAQYNLGNALSVLGRREQSNARLAEAAAAYREALAEWTIERAPGDRLLAQRALDDVRGSICSGHLKLSGLCQVDQMGLQCPAAAMPLTRRAAGQNE